LRFAGSSWKGTVVTTIDRLSAVQRLDTLAAAPMGDELAMMDLDTGNYVVLDRIGAAIWEEIAEPVRVAELIDRLCARFDVTAERCETDVMDFLRKLEARRLLRVGHA
jgi:hypothetical protein